MHSYSIITALVAVVTLAVAAPHAHGHHHLHHQLRSAKLISIAGRSTKDGVCGGDSGDMCEAGYCCSEWGYCGTTDDYCGAGCNSAFGQCNTTSSSIISLSASTASAAVSVKGSASSTSTSKSISLTATSSVESVSIAGATKFHPHQTYSAPAYSPPEISSASESSVAVATTSRVVLTTTLATLVSSSSAVQSTSEAPVVSFSTVIESSSKSRPTSTSVAVPTLSTSSSLLSSAAPAPTSSALATSTESSAISSATAGSSPGADTYKSYTGDGTTSANWPSQNAWVDFESMWSANLRIISISCTQFGQDNNSDEESADLKAAIWSVAASSGIDARFILAIVMQESKGCVRVPTTNGGVRNPGLMQDHDGTGTCNDATVTNPCPPSEIEQMIQDGTTGTAAGDGLEQCLAQSEASDVSKYYKAARIYNSGSVTDDNLSLGVATHCYASDIANRLTGWVDAPTTCSQ